MVYICSDPPWWDHDETVKKFWRKIWIRTQIDYTRKRWHTPLYTDAPPLDSPARAMSYTAIEQSMPSYHSPVILRKVEVANRRNHVMKIFFRKFDFHKNIIFFDFFSWLIVSRILISMIRDPLDPWTVLDGPLNSKIVFFILGKSLTKSEEGSLVERIIVWLVQSDP